jgi:hypothetical protein
MEQAHEEGLSLDGGLAEGGPEFLTQIIIVNHAQDNPNLTDIKSRPYRTCLTLPLEVLLGSSLSPPRSCVFKYALL